MADVAKVDFLITAKDQASNVFRGVEQSMDRLRGTYGQLATALAGAGIAGALAGALKSAIDLGDQLNKLSQRSGIAVEGLTDIVLAARLADVSMEAVGTSLSKFNVAVVEASNVSSKMGQVMQALGVDITQGPEAALRDFLERAAAIPDQALKVAVFREAFGRAGDQMILVANQMRETEGMAKKLGITMSSETAAQANQLKDQIELLKMGSQQFGIILMQNVVPALTEMTGNLLKARTEGKLLQGVFGEVAKVFASLVGAVAQPGSGADQWAQSVFNKFTPPAEAGGTAPGAAAPGATALDQMRKALSGGSGGKGKTLDDLLVAAANKRQEVYDQSEQKADAEVKRQQELAQTLREQLDPLEKIRQQILDINDLREKGFLSELDATELLNRAYDEANKKLYGTYEAQEKVKQSADDLKDLYHDFALTMSSAFSQAITSGAKFGDVLRGLGKDLLQLFTRWALIQPLQKSLEDLLGGGKGGSSSGGGTMGGVLGTVGGWFSSFFSGGGGAAASVGGSFADGGAMTPNTLNLVGERGPELVWSGPAGGTVTPNGALGGVTVTQHIKIDARADEASIRQGMHAAKEQAKAEILDSLQRGGTFAKAVGRA